jgi:serine/threonine protein kinase
MTIDTEACPTQQELTAFARLELGEDAADRIAAHLSECSRCEATVGEFSQPDELLAPLVRHSNDVSELLSEPSFQKAEDLLKNIDLSSHRGGTGDTADNPPESIGPYRLLELIGRGGMGNVYRALHTELDKIVAVKLLPEGAAGAAAESRFQRESKAVGKLSHPNIVTAFDAGEFDSRRFLAMEYVDGINLSQLVKRFGPLRMPDVCELIRQAATGLEYVHQQGMVHRDVKPSNLMLTCEGTVKLLDLGLALAGTVSAPADGNPADDEVLGTFAYMAPEQFLDSATVDRGADVYGLGATLAVLLSGKLPRFDAPRNESGREIDSLEQWAVTTLRDTRSDVPETLLHVLQRMTAAVPAQRIPTCAEAADKLRPFARDSDLRRLASLFLPDDSGGRRREFGRAAHKDKFATRRPVWRTPIALVIYAGLGIAAAFFAVQSIADRGQESVEEPEGGRQPIESRLPAGRFVSTEGSVGFRTQRAAAEWVLKRGGFVKPHGHPKVRRPAQLPAGDFLVQAVEFYGLRDIADSDLAVIVPLLHLQELNLARTSVSNAALKEIGRKPTLLYLHLNFTKVDDSGLKHLASLKELKLLSLKHTGVSDAGVPDIARLTEVDYLDISETRVGNTGLAALKPLNKLRTLKLAATKITDAGIPHLTAFPKLRRLDLAGTQITDRSVAVLGECKTLIELRLTDTRLTAAGLQQLAKLLPKCRIAF